MERLTIKKWFDFYMPDQETTTIRADNYIHIVESEDPPYDRQHHYLVGEAVDKLAHYEDLEEQGLLLKLPCKVGDMVYVFEPCHCYNNYKDDQNCHHAKTKASKYIEVVRVPKKYNSRSNTNCVKLYERPFKMDYLTKIGKSVFLTKEEAEEALRKKVEE